MVMRIKKGDTVYVRAGASRGKTGRVLHVDTKKQTVVIEGVNLKKRHQKPTQKQPKGGIVEVENPIHLSNVSLYNPALGGPTKTSTHVIDEGGRKVKVRICNKTGEQI